MFFWCDVIYIYMYNMMKYCKYDLINRIQWVCVIYRSMCDWIVLMTSGMSVAAKFEELQQQALKRLSDKDQNCQGSICSMVFFCCCCCFCCFGGGGVESLQISYLFSYWELWRWMRSRNGQMYESFWEDSIANYTWYCLSTSYDFSIFSRQKMLQTVSR